MVEHPSVVGVQDPVPPDLPAGGWPELHPGPGAALEAGTQNRNARPRCDDLVATCLLLVELGLEPSEAFLARAQEIRAGLVEPW